MPKATAIHLADPGDSSVGWCGTHVPSFSATSDRSRVTCKKCLQMMARDGALAGGAA
jgi:hypothetical protein